MTVSFGFLGCTVHINENDLFHPVRDTLAVEGPKHRSVAIRIDDTTTLRGWYLERPGCRRWAIYCYGNAQTATPTLPMLETIGANLECNVLVMDYRGYGLSDGAPSLAALHHDAPLVYDYLREVFGAEAGMIYVIGRSLGTGVAISIASQRAVAGLVLISPPTSVVDVVPIWRERFPWYLRWAISEVQADSAVAAFRPQPVEMISTVRSPLLVIHGTDDDVVPLRCGQAMVERSGAIEKKLFVVNGAGHDDLLHDVPEALAETRRLLDGKAFTSP